MYVSGIKSLQAFICWQILVVYVFPQRKNKFQIVIGILFLFQRTPTFGLEKYFFAFPLVLWRGRGENPLRKAKATQNE